MVKTYICFVKKSKKECMVIKSIVRYEYDTDNISKKIHC